MRGLDTCIQQINLDIISPSALRMLHERHMLGKDRLQPQGLAWFDVPALGSPVQALNKVLFLHFQCHTDWVCSGYDSRCVAYPIRILYV